jgi:hypothetical protein
MPAPSSSGGGDAKDFQRARWLRIWVSGPIVGPTVWGRCFIFGAMFPSKSGLIPRNQPTNQSNNQPTQCFIFGALYRSSLE